MADTILKQDQLETFFQSLISSFLGVTDPSAVRVSWPEDGAPAWEISQDVCFLKVTYADDPYTRQMVRDYAPGDLSNVTENLTYTLVILLSLEIYGPNAFDNSDIIRFNLVSNPTTLLLKQNNLALITDIPSPIRIPELFNGQWWNRASLSVKFNEKVVRQSLVPFLTTPDIQLIEG